MASSDSTQTLNNTNRKCSMNSFAKSVQNVFSGIFRRYGEFLARHPLPFIILPLLIFGGLGFGLLAMDEETDLERIYFPKESRALDDRQKVRDIFPENSRDSYNPFSVSDQEQAVNLIFNSRQNQSIFNEQTLAEIGNIVQNITNLKVETSSGTQNFTDICARIASRCVIDGAYVLSSQFQAALKAGKVVYPTWPPFDLHTSVSGLNLTGSVLNSATRLKISFKLAVKATAWYEKVIESIESFELEHSEVFYETPDSLNVELDKGTKGDIVYFSLTIAICCTYASMVTVGSDCVSSRAPLAFAGILAAGLGIVGSMGLLTLCGLKFVNIVGVVPFLTIGIGVDEMFLIMTSWSEHLPLKDQRDKEQRENLVPFLMGRTLASAAIGITITSLTDFVAFAIGTVSVFRSVTHFSMYAGLAGLFCYIANVTFFPGCLAVKGESMYDNRHGYFCFVTKSKKDLKEKDKKSGLYVCCFGGSPPEKPREDESYCEKIPRKLLPKIFTKKATCVVILILFSGILAAAIYGAVNLKQGLVLQNLVSESSYYRHYLDARTQYFPNRLPVGFIVAEKIDYRDKAGNDFLDLLKQARRDPEIDLNFERCWLSSYRNSTFYNSSSQQVFMVHLQAFLKRTVNAHFQQDVVVRKGDIVASRCFVYSYPAEDQYATANLMARMREVADKSSLPVFAYHWAFVAYEQFLAVLPATLQLAGIAVGIMALVTFLFLPNLLLTALVMLTIIMILVCVFGFMYFWDLTLSSITMIHLEMVVAFAVDFSVHVCSAYQVSDKETREERAEEAITHAASPILNGAMSTLLGVILLVASTSYIFLSFFRVMLLVIGFGMIHAVFFLPALLSLIGPASGYKPENRNGENKVSSADVEAELGSDTIRKRNELEESPSYQILGNESKLQSSKAIDQHGKTESECQSQDKVATSIMSTKL